MDSKLFYGLKSDSCPVSGYQNKTFKLPIKPFLSREITGHHTLCWSAYRGPRQINQLRWCQ